ASISLGATENYRDIEKAVRDRNLFNAAGEFPDETSLESRGEERTASSFDINAPCNKPSVNLQLVGTIYLEGGGSVVTLQEQGYSESDIYKEGDPIYGNEHVQIAKIERNRVILNNSGTKECLEVAAATPKPAGTGFPDAQPSNPTPAEASEPVAGGGA